MKGGDCGFEGGAGRRSVLRAERDLNGRPSACSAERVRRNEEFSMEERDFHGIIGITRNQSKSAWPSFPNASEGRPDFAPPDPSPLPTAGAAAANTPTLAPTQRLTVAWNSFPNA